MTYYTYTTTPAGTLLLIGDKATLHGLYWKNFKRIPKIQKDWIEDEKVFSKVIKQINEYFAGKRKEFDINTGTEGTAFQKSVWKEINKIPFGKSKSYKDIAAAVKKPTAVRAVGTAVGSNPVCLIVPCHRVLASNKKLGGYAGGLKSKEILLKIENIEWKK